MVHTVKLSILASCLSLALCSGAQAHDRGFKTLSDAEPVVQMVLQEAANEPLAGMVAVAGVALDRVSDRRWPNTTKRVIHQPYQFTGMWVAFRRYSRNQITKARIAVAVAEVGDRPCGEVLWYHTVWIKPKWNYNEIEIRCQRGNHVFYGDKR